MNEIPAQVLVKETVTLINNSPSSFSYVTIPLSGQDRRVMLATPNMSPSTSLPSQIRPREYRGRGNNKETIRKRSYYVLATVKKT